MSLLPLVLEVGPGKGERGRGCGFTFRDRAGAQEHSLCWAQPRVIDSPTSHHPDTVTCKRGQPKDRGKNALNLCKSL